MAEEQPLIIDYYSDVLCVWAYFSQIKVDQLKADFGDQIEIREHFLSLFGNNHERIAIGWEDGGYSGYAAFVQEAANHFEHVSLHPDVWLRNQPTSSMPAHLYVKAVQLLEEKSKSEQSKFAWSVREAFFSELKDVSNKGVLQELVERTGLDLNQVENHLESGLAHAALAIDIAAQKELLIEGSPTFILNNGRQKLYGNIGYRAIAANVEELLQRKIDIPAWC